MTDRPSQPQDPSRRVFFRRFAGDIVTAATQVVGAAAALQQQSADAARDLLQETEEGAAGAVFRTAFRWDGDVCLLIDQRRLPDAVVEFEVRGVADAVRALGDGVVVGCGAQAQVVAIALALAAGRARSSRPYARRASIRGAANALAVAAPGSPAVRTAIDRLLARYEGLPTDADGDTIAAELRGEAEAIVAEALHDHGGVAACVRAAFPTGAEARNVLTLGSTGTMSGGQYGTALAGIIAAHHGSVPVRVLVAETRPGLEGSRIAAWELAQAGVPCTIVTDAGAAASIASGAVDLVIVGADRICANGDVLATTGTYALAAVAGRHGVPVYVAAATTAVDLACPDASSATPAEGRPGPVLRAAGMRVAPEGTEARNPAQDVTPADLVTAFLTEEGECRAPFGPALADAVARAESGRAAAPGFAALLARRAAAAGIDDGPPPDEGGAPVGARPGAAG